MIERKTLAARIAAIKGSLWSPGVADRTKVASGSQGGAQSAITVIALVYGDRSPQLTRFIERSKFGGSDRDTNEGQHSIRLAKDVEQALDAALADFDAGITTALAVRAKGEVLGDFVSQAKASLDEQNEASDRIAAVLAAAALEETLKQLGAANGVDVCNRDMRGVIQKLKDADILVGPQHALAVGYVKFRDAAFHAQFDIVERASSQSVIAFVEGLLLHAFV